jgi:hypothetical protein
VPVAEVMEMVPANRSLSAFMPVMNIENAVQRFGSTLAFTKKLMTEGKDYGKIPGTDKPTLLKPGAEKLCAFYGFTPRFEAVSIVEDWTGNDHGGEPFFYYRYRCQLWRGDMLIAESEASCNSREKKYRYRWVPESELGGLPKEQLRFKDGKRTVQEFTFSIDSAETGGKYGKPPEYWQRFKDAISDGTAKPVKKKTSKGATYDAYEISYGETLYRVPNPDVADELNTIQKMSQKRALIASTLVACCASEYYTQDLEDRIDDEHGFTPSASTAPRAPEVAPWDGEEPESQKSTVDTSNDPEQLQTFLKEGMKGKDEFLRLMTMFKLQIVSANKKAGRTTGLDKVYYETLAAHDIRDAKGFDRLDAAGTGNLIRAMYAACIKLSAELKMEMETANA